jgi:hypothetical protein
MVQYPSCRGTGITIGKPENQTIIIGKGAAYFFIPYVQLNQSMGVVNVSARRFCDQAGHRERRSP